MLFAIPQPVDVDVDVDVDVNEMIIRSVRNGHAF